MFMIKQAKAIGVCKLVHIIIKITLFSIYSTSVLPRIFTLEECMQIIVCGFVFVILLQFAYTNLLLTLIEIERQVRIYQLELVVHKNCLLLLIWILMPQICFHFCFSVLSKEKTCFHYSWIYIEYLYRTIEIPVFVN